MSISCMSSTQRPVSAGQVPATPARAPRWHHLSFPWPETPDPPRTEKRTGADTKDHTPVKHIPIFETLQSVPNSKETPQKGSTNSILTHQVFFKALAKGEKIHTSFHSSTWGLCQNNLQKTPITHTLYNRSHCFEEPELASLGTQGQNTAHHRQRVQ